MVKLRAAMGAACAIVIAACMAPERQQTVFEGGGAAGAADASIDTSSGGSAGSSGTSAGGAAGSSSGGTAGEGGVDAGVAVCRWSLDSENTFDNTYKSEGPTGIGVGHLDSTYVIGNVQSSGIDFGKPLTVKAAQGAYLTKLLHDGTHAWSRAIDGSGKIEASDIAASSDRIVIVGAVEPHEAGSTSLNLQYFGVSGVEELGTVGSGWVIALDAADNRLWHKVFTPELNYVRISSVALDSKGDAFVVGQGSGPVDLGCGTNNPEGKSFIARLGSTSGECKWAHTFEASAASVAIGPDDNPVIVGSFGASFTVLQTMVPFFGGESDLFAVKLASDGKLVMWARGMGDQGADTANSVGVDLAGNVWIAGTFTDQIELGGDLVKSPFSATGYLLKLSGSQGYQLGHHLLGSVEIPAPRGVAVGGGNRVAVTGTLVGDWDFGGGVVKGYGGNVFAARYDDLAFRYARSWGDLAPQTGRAAAVYSEGDVALAGVYEDKLSFWSPCSQLTDLPLGKRGFVARVGVE